MADLPLGQVSAGTDWPGVSILSLGAISISDLQLQSQCGGTLTCLSRSVPEIQYRVAGILTNQQTPPLIDLQLQSQCGST